MSEDTSGQVQKHITTACTYCRRRKVKCDGASPICSNCRLYKQVCEYNHGEDRRKLSRKKQMESLSNRVKVLEELLRLNGIAVPPEDSDNDNSPSLEARAASVVSKRVKVPSKNQNDHQGQCDYEFPPAAIANIEPLVRPVEGMGGQQSEFPMDLSSNSIPQQDFSMSWDSFMPIQDHSQMPPPSRPLNDDFIDVISDAPWPQDSVGNVDFSYSDAVVVTPPSLNSQSQAKGIQLHDQPHHQKPTNRTKQRTHSFMEWHDDNSWATHDDRRHIPVLESQHSDEMIDQLSARIGSFQIAEDGQLRYFGATSNLHILHNGASSLSRTPTRSVRTEGALALQRADLAQSVSVEFERHLEKLYFAWEDPAIHVVDMEMYYHEQEKYNNGEDGTSFYSETLKNAICAIGANLTTRSQQGLPETVPEFFSSRAKTLLEIEMDSPSVATVQALVIMSASEAAFTRDARGWIYSGMAVRISADLGLHLDLSSHVQDGILTAHELDVRRTTFWGVFIHDNMWSLYVGRPWGINIRDISISRPPTELDKVRNKLWYGYRDEMGSTDSTIEKPGLYDPIEACADSNVSLCAMMRRLSRILYSGRNLSDEELRNFAADMRREFSDWHKSLSPELAIDLLHDEKVYLPHVLQLHMQFHAVSIFLHRPFFSRNVRDQQVSTQAQLTCVEAAQSIVKLLRIYRNQHTLRHTNIQIVHLLFTASLIHIYNTCSSSGKGAENAMADLQFCCQALGEIGVVYKNATRALEVVICIKQEWQRKANALKLKRPGSVISNGNGEETRRKRRITDDTQAERPRLTPSTQERDHYNVWETSRQLSSDNSGVNGLTRDMFPMLGTFPDDSFGYGFLNTEASNENRQAENRNGR